MVVGLLIGSRRRSTLRGCRLLASPHPRRFGALREQTATDLSARNAEVDRRLAGLDRHSARGLPSSTSASTRALQPRHHGQPDQPAARRGGRSDEDDDRARPRSRPARAGAAASESTRRLWRTLAREPPSRPPATGRLRTAVHVSNGRARGCGSPRRGPTTADRREVPARQLRASRLGRDDAERQLHEKAFARDVKGHIDAIAGKYIRPDFGDVRIRVHVPPRRGDPLRGRRRKTGALLSYAHERRVFPVSATTFTAYLQMIVLGLRGLQIEQTAQDVMKQLAGLESDFGRFRDDFESSASTSLERAEQVRGGREAARPLRDEARARRHLEVEAVPPATSTLPRALDAA